MAGLQGKVPVPAILYICHMTAALMTGSRSAVLGNDRAVAAMTFETELLTLRNSRSVGVHSTQQAPVVADRLLQ